MANERRVNPRLVIATIDVHAAGEPGRVLIGNHLLARGATMAEKLEYARTNLDCHHPDACEIDTAWCARSLVIV
jgi:proline racemase